MSVPEKANLRATIKNIHSNVMKELDSIILETKEFKYNIDNVLSDFTQQCMDVEDRLKDVLKQKKVILAEYEVLQSKDKEDCEKCTVSEVNLNKATRKLKQYEMKLKKIGNLLYVKTANTEANQLDLMSHVMELEYSVDSQFEEKKVLTHEDPADQQIPEVKEKCNSHEAGISPIKVQVPTEEANTYLDTTLRENGKPTSKILVPEEVDEIFFETTLKRKTPDDAETIMEIPETFCEEFEYFDQAKKFQDENSPIKHETPIKKRKLSQCSPKAICSQQSPRSVHRKSQTPTPVSPLQLRNRTVSSVADRHDKIDTSSFLISKSKRLLKIKDKKMHSSKLKNSPKRIESPAKKSLQIESIAENPSISVEFGVEDKQKMHQESNRWENDETRFPLFEPQHVEEQKEYAKPVTDKIKAKSKNKTNGSRIWEIIEFSDDSDDFVDTRKSKPSLQKKETSFSTIKTAAADTKCTKWNLKPLSSSINKSKLQQTKLTVEKKVSKIDITQAKGYNGGVLPSCNSKTKDSHEVNKHIIEETQELENQSDDKGEIETIAKNVSYVRATSPDMNRPSSSFTLTLPEESMFIPNAVSTQKTKRHGKNSNSCKQSITQENNTNVSSPKRNQSLSRNRSPGNIDSKTPPNAFKKPSTRTSRIEVCSPKKVLFLPKESKHNVDYSSQWKCTECIDYFVNSYGAPILKIRPPPKKCGHSSKYPSSTPPDFWDPMCS